MLYTALFEIWRRVCSRSLLHSREHFQFSAEFLAIIILVQCGSSWQGEIFPNLLDLGHAQRPLLLCQILKTYDGNVRIFRF